LIDRGGARLQVGRVVCGWKGQAAKNAAGPICALNSIEATGAAQSTGNPQR
jgi:hypothetical protein